MTFPELIFAQSNRIISLLQEGKFQELRGLYSETSGVDKAFLEAIFETDGYRAVLRYKDIADDYPHTPFYYEAVKRLQEYRRIKGDYVITYFWVQTGAFAELANAERLKKELTQMGFKAKIVKKQSDKTLYILRVGAYDSESKAKEAAQRIESKLLIKTRLVTEGG